MLPRILNCSTSNQRFLIFCKIKSELKGQLDSIVATGHKLDSSFTCPSRIFYLENNTNCMLSIICRLVHVPSHLSPTIVIENKRAAVIYKKGGYGESRDIFEALQSCCYPVSCPCRKKRRGIFREPERSAVAEYKQYSTYREFRHVQKHLTRAFI